MIARVQATTKRVQFKGKEAEVWEGISPTGIRFHLFVTGAQIMAGQDLREKKFKEELADDVKQPAAETAALPQNVATAADFDARFE